MTHGSEGLFARPPRRPSAGRRPDFGRERCDIPGLRCAYPGYYVRAAWMQAEGRNPGNDLHAPNLPRTSPISSELDSLRPALL